MRLRYLLVVAGVFALAAQALAVGCEWWNTPVFFGSATPEETRGCLAAGADVNARDVDGLTPLHYAATFSDSTIVIGYLLEFRAEINARDLSGRTPLHFAVTNTTEDARYMVSILIDLAGADVNARDVDGLTPLHYAAAVAHDPMIIWNLAAKDADASARDADGNTPWDYAQENEALRGTDAWWWLRAGSFE